MKSRTALVAWLGDAHPARFYLMENAQYMCILPIGLMVLRVMRFAPGGILPMGRHSK